jgi:hypothetical protein
MNNSDQIREKTYTRQFVPADADMGDWSQIESIFDALDSRSIDSVERLDSRLVSRRNTTLGMWR